MTRTDIKKLIAESNSIALCLADIKTLDKACSTAALYLSLIQIGKKVDIYTNESPSGKTEKLFNMLKVEPKEKIEQAKYVIKIDYSKTPIEKVSFDTDEKNGKVYFYITPKGEDFDFDNVEYIKDGSDYDLTIIIGAKKFTDMGEIYQSHPNLFKKKKIISFSRDMESPCENTVEIPENKSYCTVVYDFVLDNMIENLKKDSAQALLTGVLDYSTTLEGELSDEESSDISDLIHEGADISKALKFVYFSKSVDDVITQSILMENVNIDDDNGIA